MMLNIETKKEIKAPGRAVTSQYAQIIKNEESIHNLRQVKYSLFFISWQSETFVRIFCHITQYINTYINRKKQQQAIQSVPWQLYTCIYTTAHRTIFISFSETALFFAPFFRKQHQYTFAECNSWEIGSREWTRSPYFLHSGLSSL